MKKKKLSVNRQLTYLVVVDILSILPLPILSLVYKNPRDKFIEFSNCQIEIQSFINYIAILMIGICIMSIGYAIELVSSKFKN